MEGFQAIPPIQTFKNAGMLQIMKECAEPTRLLIVDDDSTMLGSVKDFLTSSGGFEVRGCSDFDRAVQVALDFKPMIILLDIQYTPTETAMGLSVAAKLRDSSLTGSAVIFFTNCDLPFSEWNETSFPGTQSPRNLFISKARFSPKELIKQLRQIVQNCSEARAPTCAVGQC